MIGKVRVFAAASGMVALAFLGTACGGAEKDAKGNGTTAAAGGATRAGGMTDDQRLKMAKCMRENGVDMPDPKPGDQGLAITVGKGVSMEKMQAAMKKCRTQVGLPAEPKMTQAEKDKALKFARCMREHGIDMPDPKFDSSGSVLQRAARADQGDPQKFEKAMKECNADG